jgi:hypothetical protein
VSSFFSLLLLSFGTVILLSSVLTGNDSNARNMLPSPLPSGQINLHVVKITSPIKDQQIPVHSNLAVTGISSANSTSANCEVSVIVNGIKPYQKAIPTGRGGPNDYSTWNYTLTPAYAAIKQGQNKITAKLSCSNNPSLTSHNSVNVTGVINSNPEITALGSLGESLPNNNKLLSISLYLAKNPVKVGSKETLKTKVFAANSNLTVAGASVKETVTDPANTTITNFNGTTDNSGTFTYTWKVSKDSRSGVFTVNAQAFANGYQNPSAPTRTTFNVNSGAEYKSSTSISTPTHHVHTSIPQNKTVNCRLFILSTGPCS